MKLHFSRYLKVYASSSESSPGVRRLDTRFVNIHQIDQMWDGTIEREIDDAKVQVPITTIALHDGDQRTDVHLYIEGFTASQVREHIDKLIHAELDYARAGPPAKADDEAA